MALDFIKKKSEAMGKKPMASQLKVNKYENPQMVLDLIAHICMAKKNIDIFEYFTPYLDAICEAEETFSNKYADYRFNDNLLDDSFSHAFNKIAEALYDSSSTSLKIAVAGGYSAGKSSFLNSLTEIGDKLPTGIEPVSVVNTYLSCSTSTKELAVRGKNLRGNMVLLEEDVLSCIQHSSKTKIYVASVLEKIMMDVPVKREFLNRITFIDTPEHNNSIQKNSENNKTDEETATEAFELADAIFWCIDIEAGAISKRDLEILQKAKDKPIVIIFTKMDKKPASEVKNILEKAVADCKGKLSTMPVDIMGYSSTNNNMLSYQKKQFSNTIADLWRIVGNKDVLAEATNIINTLFFEEIKNVEEFLTERRKHRQELIKRKSDHHKNAYDAYDDEKDALKEIILNSYDDIVDKLNGMVDLYNNAIKGWAASLDREVEWSDKTGFFSDSSKLLSQCKKANNQFDRLANNDWEAPELYSDEFRKHVYETFCKSNDILQDQENDQLEDIEQACKDVTKTANDLENYKKELTSVRQGIVNILKKCYETSLAAVEKHYSSLNKMEKEQDTDIFSAIAADNMRRFFVCFSNGVDLTKCNKEGYSPITYAVKSGNNQMINFFIQHEVDFSIKDQRGYNALETAVLCHYKDICELLLKYDRTLQNASSSLVELSKKNDFEKWIAQY